MLPILAMILLATRAVVSRHPDTAPNSIETMRILLQHARTGLYLRGLGDWAANPNEAFDFQHSQKAIDYACKHGIIGVQIAVRFIDGECDEVVPLPGVGANSSVGRLTVTS